MAARRIKFASSGTKTQEISLTLKMVPCLLCSS